MNAQLIEIRDSGQLASLSTTGSIGTLDSEKFVHEAPEAHWVLVNAQHGLLARCSLWWKKTPPHSSHALGLIGHYAAINSESGRRLLRHACGQLASKGCTMAVGPMDGSTWRSYRFTTERGTEPPFFLEADHPDDWPLQFAAEGFTALAHYSSALNLNLTHEDPRLPAIAERASAQGITICRATPENMDEDLRRIYAVSLKSFQNNFLYTPLDKSEFMAQYAKVLPYVRPELLLLAERENELIGFLFALPDLLQAKRGAPIDRVVMKTLAVVPEHASAGLGTLLMAQSHRTARELGYKACIHAYMQESNRSRRISNRTAVTIRRYTLFAKLLAP